MQNDSWLTDASHSDNCPLCSQPLSSGVQICPACGFLVRAPARASAIATEKRVDRQASSLATHVPARASAQRMRSMIDEPSRRLALPLSPHSSSAQSPEQGWQYESPIYEAASSLSALSLILTEVPTAPPRTTRRLSGQTDALEHIDEIDTFPQTSSEPQSTRSNPLETPLPHSLPGDNFGAPPQSQPASYQLPTLFPAFDEIDTLPDPGALIVRTEFQPAPLENSEIALDAGSWSGDSDSRRVRKSRRATRRRRFLHFGLLDRARWWLVHPGHIELLFRLVGALLVLALTFFLAFIIILNLPVAGRGNFPISTTPASMGVATFASSSTVLPTPMRSSPTPGASPGSTPTIQSTASVSRGTPQVTATVVQQSGSNVPPPVHSPDVANPLFAQLTHLNPLVWVIGLCYFLSLCLLSMASILRRRHR